MKATPDRHQAVKASRPGSRCGGFTLIELVATMVILAALSSVGAGILITATDGYTNASLTAQLHNEASIAMDRMVREVRSIGLDTGAGGSAPDIDTVTATSLAWGGNSSFSLSGTNIMLTKNGGTARVLLKDVSSFSVQAYDEADNTMAASLSGTGCDTIRRLSLSVTLTRNGVSHTLRTKLFLRATM